MEMKYLQDQKNPNLRDEKKDLHEESSSSKSWLKRQLGMGLSLTKGYQQEALMEGKKTTTSILPLAIDLREIERWRSNEQRRRRNTLGLAGISGSQEIARRGREEETPPYIDNGYGSHNLKV